MEDNKEKVQSPLQQQDGKIQHPQNQREEARSQIMQAAMKYQGTIEIYDPHYML